jgi:hypothetical protein
VAEIYLDGRPAADLSLYVYSMEEGWWGGPDVQRAMPRPAPGQAGVQLSGYSYPMMPARQVKVNGKIVTSANTVAARVAAESVLRDTLLNQGLVWMQLDDGINPLRGADVFIERVRIRPVGHPLVAVVSEVELSCTSPSALWRLASGTAVAIAAASTRYTLPLGTAPSAPIIRVMGAATTPSVVYRNSAGVVQVQIAVPTLTSTEYADLNMETLTLQKVSSGTGTDISGLITVTTGSLPFALDPAHGNYELSAWPTLEVTAGTAEVLYTKRYL